MYTQVYKHEKGDVQIADLLQTSGSNPLYEFALKKNEPNPKELAKAMGLNITGWTWNAKFADLDGDQWQDLYAANGWHEKRGGIPATTGSRMRLVSDLSKPRSCRG